MEEVREELIKFKEYTEQLINSIKEDKIHLVPHFLKERQTIINSLSKKNISRKTFQEIGKALNLMELEKVLQEIYISKKQEIFVKLQENKNNAVANNTYLFSSRVPLNFIDKKL